LKKVTKKNKRYTKSRQRYQLIRRKWALGTRRRKKTKKSKRSRAPDFVDAITPSKFTLEKDNIKSVLTYIGNVKKYGVNKKDVNFILTDVTEIGIGAISMLISVMQELEERGVYFKGKKPINDAARNILEKSGFMGYVEGTISDLNRTTRNMILTTGKSNTHQKNIVKEIHKSNYTIWGESGRSPLIYGMIVEMVKNSTKHAFKTKDKVRWHLAVSHDEENKKVKFSFVDNGLGIISSFKQDNLSRIIRGVFRNNIEMITLAFKEGIESKTGLSWRGTGLPTIYEAFEEDKVIKRLVVITNDVYCDFENDIKIDLSKAFSGTFYYWEMDDTCVKHCFK
jgi:hypothetical protein